MDVAGEKPLVGPVVLLEPDFHQIGSRDAGRTRTYRRRTTPRDLLREMRNQNPFNREER